MNWGFVYFEGLFIMWFLCKLWLVFVGLVYYVICNLGVIWFIFKLRFDYL